MGDGFKGTIFLNYYGDTDLDSNNYTPGRYLSTVEGPNHKKQSN